MQRQANITVILNCQANSQRAQETCESVSALFKRQSADFHMIQCEQGSDIQALARQAVASGSAIVAAGGGDGSIRAVASAIVGTQAALGVLPLGTFNHFAKDMGIPTELDAAIATLISGAPVKVDVGEVNGVLFLNNSSLGLYPAVVREREKTQDRGFSKWASFIAAVIHAFYRYGHLHVTFDKSAGRNAVNKTPFVFIGNNQYETAGLRIGKRQRLDAGRLWIYQAPRAGRLTLLRLAVSALLGRRDLRELEVFDTQAIEITTREPAPQVAVDGEVLQLQSPLRYRINPKALTVMAPAAAGRAS